MRRFAQDYRLRIYYDVQLDMADVKAIERQGYFGCTSNYRQRMQMFIAFYVYHIVDQITTVFNYFIAQRQPGKC